MARKIRRKKSRLQNSIDYHWRHSRPLNSDGSRKSELGIRKSYYHWAVHQWEVNNHRIMPKKQRDKLYRQKVGK